MRSNAFENFYLSFWCLTFNKNKEVEIFFKLFFRCDGSVIGKNFFFRD